MVTVFCIADSAEVNIRYTSQSFGVDADTEPEVLAARGLSQDRGKYAAYLPDRAVFNFFLQN